MHTEQFSGPKNAEPSGPEVLAGWGSKRSMPGLQELQYAVLCPRYSSGRVLCGTVLACILPLTRVPFLLLFFSMALLLPYPLLLLLFLHLLSKLLLLLLLFFSVVLLMPYPASLTSLYRGSPAASYCSSCTSLLWLSAGHASSTSNTNTAFFSTCSPFLTRILCSE